MTNTVLFSAKNKEENATGKNEHAKRVAAAIADATNLSSYPIGKHTSIPITNVLFIGCEVHGDGKPTRDFLRVLNELNPKDVKTVAIFSVAKSGTVSALAAAKPILEAKGIPVCDEEFFCKGASGFSNRGCPTEKDLQDAKEFGAMIAAKYR